MLPRYFLVDIIETPIIFFNYNLHNTGISECPILLVIKLSPLVRPPYSGPSLKFRREVTVLWNYYTRVQLKYSALPLIQLCFSQCISVDIKLQILLISKEILHANKSTSPKNTLYL